MADYQLGVIGAGNMAEAIIAGVTSSGFLRAGAIIAADPDAARRRQMETLGVCATQDTLAAAGCPNILLAVKPQIMVHVLGEIAPAVNRDARVISIAAGKTTAFIDAALGGAGRIIRVMPNTPLLVGAGMSAIAAGPRADSVDVAWVAKLLGACGHTLEFQEAQMDAVTAVSGSGPAYFFYLIEAMTAAGVQEGLGEQEALELAAQTCAGAARLIEETKLSPRQLRQRVTSPGGTTERAIKTLDEAGVRQALVGAVRAAAERSRELGRK